MRQAPDIKSVQKIAVLLVILLVVIGISSSGALANRAGQEGTPMIATVTGTPSGPMAVVNPGPNPEINLRSGPNTTYDRVGVLLIGQRVPARGQSPGGEWIQVEYPGVPGGLAWVWSLYVSIEPMQALPIIEPPPTPTPRETVTIDPTLAAKFIITAEATRPPTFTAAPPLAIPTFREETNTVAGGVPMGFVILGLAGLGFLFGIIAFFQGR